MPHQWMEGNLPVSSKCAVCDKTCGSVLRLQDWRCLWCRASVHTACRPQISIKCPLGLAKVSVVPPTALHSIGNLTFLCQLKTFRMLFMIYIACLVNPSIFNADGVVKVICNLLIFT